MKQELFFRLFFPMMLFLLNSAKGQSDPFAYAVTAESKGGTEWIALRKLDTRTATFSNIILNLQESDQQIADFPAAVVYTSPRLSNPVVNLSGKINSQPSTGSSVAAIAYDRKNNRLWFVPMNSDQLHYIDLSNNGIITIPDQFFSKAGNYNFKNNGPISRLVITPDDFGYTITNDGTHLLRFTTKGSSVITDLGDLLDDPLNRDMGIHSPCTNSGGDLIADDSGNLILVTGSNKVYQVEIATRKTTYITTITGLPQKFTTSGAAVGENGKELVLSSSTFSDAYYIVNPETWAAYPSGSLHNMYESADLANSNVLITKAGANAKFFNSKSPENLHNVRIFPNPAIEDKVSIQFNTLPAGNYTIQLADLLGKTLIQQAVFIQENTQTVVLHIPGTTLQGLYYIRILNEKNNSVSTQKLLLERW